MLCHATSTYPAQAAELNLRMIHTLQARVPERADRLLRPRDRAPDHARRGGHGRGVRRAAHHPRPGHVGLRPGRLGRAAAACIRLVRDIRVISEAMGDGVKQVYDGELRRDEEAAPGRRVSRRRERAAGGLRDLGGLHALALVESPAQLLNVIELGPRSEGRTLRGRARSPCSRRRPGRSRTQLARRWPLAREAGTPSAGTSRGSGGASVARTVRGLLAELGASTAGGGRPVLRRDPGDHQRHPADRGDDRRRRHRHLGVRPPVGRRGAAARWHQPSPTPRPRR